MALWASLAWKARVFSEKIADNARLCQMFCAEFVQPRKLASQNRLTKGQISFYRLASNVLFWRDFATLDGLLGAGTQIRMRLHGLITKGGP